MNTVVSSFMHFRFKAVEEHVPLLLCHFSAKFYMVTQSVTGNMLDDGVVLLHTAMNYVILVTEKLGMLCLGLIPDTLHLHCFSQMRLPHTKWRNYCMCL
jgi:hypothetical protein